MPGKCLRLCHPSADPHFTPPDIRRDCMSSFCLVGRHCRSLTAPYSFTSIRVRECHKMHLNFCSPENIIRIHPRPSVSAWSSRRRRGWSTHDYLRHSAGYTHTNGIWIKYDECVRDALPSCKRGRRRGGFGALEDLCRCGERWSIQRGWGEENQNELGHTEGIANKTSARINSAQTKYCIVFNSSHPLTLLMLLMLLLLK